MDEEGMRIMRENGSKPVRICSKGIFIGDDAFLYPVIDGSISVKPCRGKFNELTLTLFVGEVTVETRKRIHFPEPSESGD